MGLFAIVTMTTQDMTVKVINKNLCKAYSCFNGGNCTVVQHDTLSVFYNYTAACVCPNTWKGSRCEDDVNECLVKSTCGRHGHCSNSKGDFMCFCDPGYEGKHCERDINECASMPCKNNGTCENRAGNFLCRCSQYWTGTYCDQDIDECKYHPCENQGIFKETILVPAINFGREDTAKSTQTHVMPSRAKTVRRAQIQTQLSIANVILDLQDAIAMSMLTNVNHSIHVGMVGHV